MYVEGSGDVGVEYRLVKQDVSRVGLYGLMTQSVTGG